ncbi:Similar to Mmab: Corrinoid adenosyltransferase (Mus musculus) [Cotesia congregata]|uniref:Similar to Mmab: Corrinoid adenosyltransferase (Mus musculus) n=1 Tax=Cotesia congregata TaxID=51543 RepID=A0A8J2MKY7_COTCN|nr:Similar to Mmab: Corrinoid adenosyltransferase (Mus musculus) [Cotesia congregata]
MELVKHSWRKYLLVYNSHLSPLVRQRVESKIIQKAFLSSSSEKKSDKLTDDDVIFNAIGATDELSSYIGLAREFACETTVQHPYVDKLKRVQMILFDINNAITRIQKSSKINSFKTKHTQDLEEWITEYANQLPPPEDYIIPRAERSITPLVYNGFLDKETQNYLHRLSEFLFTVSRIAAKCDQRTESIYIPPAEVQEK